MVALVRCAPIAFALAVLLGSVADRTTGQPLPGVSVIFGSAHATTRADGSFRLVGVKPGHGTLTVESDDVPPQHVPITVGAKPARVDLRVCSTTLDYNCGPAQ